MISSNNRTSPGRPPRVQEIHSYLRHLLPLQAVVGFGVGACVVEVGVGVCKVDVGVGVGLSVGVTRVGRGVITIPAELASKAPMSGALPK